MPRRRRRLHQDGCWAEACLSERAQGEFGVKNYELWWGLVVLKRPKASVMSVLMQESQISSLTMHGPVLQHHSSNVEMHTHRPMSAEICPKVWFQGLSPKRQLIEFTWNMVWKILTYQQQGTCSWRKNSKEKIKTGLWCQFHYTPPTTFPWGSTFRPHVFSSWTGFCCLSQDCCSYNEVRSSSQGFWQLQLLSPKEPCFQVLKLAYFTGLSFIRTELQKCSKTSLLFNFRQLWWCEIESIWFSYSQEKLKNIYIYMYGMAKKPLAEFT